MSGPAQPDPRPPAVEVDGLTIRYGDRTAVHDLHLEARPGEVLGLLGRNGAGKTSTIEALEGFVRPSAGSVRVLGRDPMVDRRRLAVRVGVMPQDGGIAPAARPEEITRLYAAYYPQALDPDALLTRLGLDDVRRTPWRRLSGGERQRLSMALALVGRPEVLFLDEPTAGVDVQGRQVIREVVGEQAAAGTCVLLATHELDEAERVAHRIAVIDAGRLVADGTLAELTAGTDAIVWRGPADLDTEALSVHLGTAVHTTAPRQFRVEGTASPGLLARLTGWLADRDVTAEGLRSGPGTLEDAFVALTGRRPDGPDPQPDGPAGAEYEDPSPGPDAPRGIDRDLPPASGEPYDTSSNRDPR